MIRWFSLLENHPFGVINQISSKRTESPYVDSAIGSNRVRRSEFIVTQAIGLAVVDEIFSLRIESDLPTELPADRGCKAGHVPIPDSRGVTDRLVAGLDTIQEVADVQERIGAADLILGLALEKCWMT